jgi:two-component system chemotaxis sensor kinase CheA
LDTVNTATDPWRLPMQILLSSLMDKDLLASFTHLSADQILEVPASADVSLPLVTTVQTPSPVAAPLLAQDTPAPEKAVSAVAVAPPRKPAAVADEQGKVNADNSLRVNVKILDNLMTQAGELVLTRNQFLQIVHSRSRQDFDAVSQRLDLVTSELQEAIMSTRMQPVGNVFNKFKRVVRDLAQKLGKEIELVLEGGEVEMDKTIIEALADPLTHLVRNSVDHGIELPEIRTLAGKAAAGTLQIKAFHEGGQVIIEIIDDGAGIDTARVKEKVLSMGAYDRSQLDAMQEHELLRLIFLPGLSTAREVTDVSGRGVGMDVVHANLSKVGGVFDIASKLGKGTTITIKLPLTLAIIPSLVVSVGGERFAIPQVNMVELVRVPAARVRERIERIGSALVMRLRGELLPIISLAEALGIEERIYHDPELQQVKTCRRQRIDDRRGLIATPSESAAPSAGGAAPGQAHSQPAGREIKDRRHSPQSAVNILVVSVGKFHYGLIVDKLLDSEEIVVKPLGSHLRKCQVYAGATIQGDGRVALILDVVGISKAMNLSAVADRVRSKGQQEADQVNLDAQSLLIVRNSPHEQMAITLGLISRIEKINRRQIECTGGRRNMQYRGGTLPLFSIDEAARVTPPDEQSSHLYVVVFPFGEREIGIMVSQIIDIITVSIAIDDTTHKQPGIMGSAIILEQITLLVDLFGVVSTVMPEWVKFTMLAASESGSGQHILVVEDSKFFNRQICDFISSAGFTPFSAMDGLEGLAVLERESIDLVLTDIEMPNMDGLELTARIRMDPRWCKLPVIAVTSLTGEAAEKRGKKAGVNEYMIKLDREKIIHAINRYLKP